MYFAWRMSALQCWVSFCSPAVGLSCMLRMCAYPLSCAALLPAAFPGSSQSPSAARCSAAAPQLCASSMGVMSVRAALSIGSRVHTPVLHTCVSLPALRSFINTIFVHSEYIGFFFFPFRSKDHWVYYTIPVIQLLEEVKRSNLNLKFIDWTCLYILTTFNNNSKKSLITTQIQTAEIPTTNRTKPLFPPHNRV